MQDLRVASRRSDCRTSGGLKSSYLGPELRPPLRMSLTSGQQTCDVSIVIVILQMRKLRSEQFSDLSTVSRVLKARELRSLVPRTMPSSGTADRPRPRGFGWEEGIRKGTQPVAYILELGARVLEENIELPAPQETWGQRGQVGDLASIRGIWSCCRHTIGVFGDSAL